MHLSDVREGDEERVLRLVAREFDGPQRVTPQALLLGRQRAAAVPWHEQGGRPEQEARGDERPGLLEHPEVRAGGGPAALSQSQPRDPGSPRMTGPRTTAG